MRVKCLNSSAWKTRNLIKETFANLLNEKRQLEKITVTELVKRANITRSTFYTHFDNIYQVAKEYQMQTIELLCNEELQLNTKEDIKNYFDNIFTCLKDNADVYKLLLSADESLLFLRKLKDIAGDKIYKALKKINNDNNLEFKVSFMMDGMIIEILKYFRGESAYSLEDIHQLIQELFKDIF